MAGARLKAKNKQYEQLVRGTDKLHRDIENLETAYFLHRQIVEEDQNNVRGMIRKEVGGPRWAHGGAGKLTTYKSRKDLVDQKHQILQKDSANNQTNQSSSELNSRTKVLDENEQSSNIDLLPVQVEKILDLKTKVLKKASSNIIRRDTWSAPSASRLVKPANNKVTKLGKDKDKGNTGGKKENADTSVSKPSKPVRRHNSLRREGSESSSSPGYTVQKTKESKQQKVQTRTFKKERHQTDIENDGIKSQRRSRIDVFKDSEESVRSLRNSVSDAPEQNGFDSDVSRGDKSERTNGLTYTPRKLQVHSGKVIENGVSSGIFPTQPQEPTEIYIDPRKGQVRVLAGREENFNDISSLEGTKVLVQSSSLQNSLDGNKLACSVVEESSNSSPRKEIRDIFGLEDFNSRLVNTGRKNVTSTSPFAASRQCNTEVEFWLRGLGIPDVERYVRIFADNEIDLTDLEFMSASQLHDMGVTAFGALDKILKGIRDLKNQPVTQVENSSSVKLQASSVAWEEMSSAQKKKTVSDKSSSKASKVRKSNSCHHETFVKQSHEYSLLGYRDTDYERCSSATSQSEGNVETPKNSARSETPSFAASTKSSSAKCTEKRPPSAKTSSNVKNKNNISQSQNKNVCSSSKLRRSNSAASEKPEPKLSNLENKPTKGVLLRPRSASLTREPPRGTRETQGKKAEEKKEPRQLRARSRSADVVKRKALEGVHAAAKKFEEKKLKSKETDKSFPPCDERKKLRRDEMAARHLQREKYKEMMVADSGSSDTDENVKQHPRETDSDRGLENLVTVNILSPPGKSDPQASPSKQDDKSKTQSVRPEMRKSLRRLEQTRRQKYSAVRPIDLQMESDTEPPLLATYKVSNKDRDKNQSEPESGYRTDGSTTYSQIEDRVSDIQRKIKRLKARATSGDEMTLTLVQDLQEQLSHFEKQLKDKEKEMRYHQSDPESSRENQQARRLPVNLNSSTNTSPISELLVESPVRPEEEHEHVGSEVRMSKRELLDEMRKEKQQHHRQIRQLQTELQKFRHSDPVTSLELDQKDITYKQDDLIGEGTFSCVYKGEFQGSEVAVKQLKMPLQQQDRNYFAAEVSLLKELRHPRVVLLIGVCTSSKLPLMVLEYMSQGSLFNYLHNPECESLDHALYYQVARDIALGMNYLHSHKPEVLHLDLKSMNVLLCESLRAKIADFGFSKLRLDAGLKSGKRGKSKTKVAAPAWMSPELLDKGEITGKSDVFSFGIILWEMLTRSSPYKDCTVFQILEMVRKNQRPEIPEGTPEGLSHLVKMCWDPNPAKRPQFKDILLILENLAFPPAWRELFQKAGVPESALHDVQSTRTIISLVTGTLDSGKSGILHSFMVAHSEKGKNSQRKENIETDTTFKSKRSASRRRRSKCKQSVEESLKDSARSSASSRVSSRLDDYDSDTVTNVSEKLSSEDSDLTLRNIRDSSSDDNDDRSDSDESSVLTSDDDFNYSTHVNKQKMPKTEINVVIPNLELSLQSVREEFKAERDRISRESSDWVSLSLDDRTDRSELNEGQKAELFADNKADHGDMRLRLSSNLSSRSPTPPSPTKSTPSMLNESARIKRRNKGKDLNRFSDEFLMRESFHNRRPPSPKKKSLTKKFMETSDRKLGNENTEDIDDLTDRSVKSVKSNLDRKSSDAKKESYVERSYDSFFDLSDKQVYSGARKRQSLTSGSQSCGSFESSSENAKVVEPFIESQKRMDEDKKGIDPSCEISVEDMENEVKAEGSPRKQNETPRCLIKSGNSNSAQDFELVVNKSQRLMMEEIRNRNGSVQPFSKNEVEKGSYVKSVNLNKSYPNKSNESDKFDLSRSYALNIEELRRKGRSCELVNRHNRQQMSEIKELNQNNNSKISRTGGICTETQSDHADAGMVYQNPDSVESHQYGVDKNRTKLKQTRKLSEERRKHTSGDGISETSVGMSSGQIEPHDDNIRVVLNPELTGGLESIAASSEGPVKLLETNTPTFDKGMCQNNKLYEENTEQIRVTLDLSKVSEKKKKPTITPRRSLMLSNRSLKSNEGTMIEVNRNADAQKNDIGENKNTEIDSSSTHLAGNTSKNSKLLKQSGQADSLNHDSGSDPNMKSSSWSSGPYVNTSESKFKSVENRKNKEVVPSPKKNTIRVKLRKDPLAQPTDSSGYDNTASSLPMPPSSPVPPAPPPPPPALTRSVSLVSRSMQDNAPRGSMADELKSRLANRQSVSEGMLFKGKMSERNNIFKKQPQGKNVRVPTQDEGQPRLVKISEMDEKLFPQQSEGLPSFVVQSLDLRDQKDQLKSISKPHPHQLDDLSNASQEQLTSIADILKKAVMGRRLAMGEDGDSVSQSLESAATGWSVDL